MVNIRKTPPSNPAASCSIISSALCWQPFFPPIIQTQCLQVCLSNVIYWSGIPLIPSAALSDSIIYSLGCHATTLIHWLSSLIQCRGCNFTFHCALLQAARTNSPHSLLITKLCEILSLNLYFSLQSVSHLKIPVFRKIHRLAATSKALLNRVHYKRSWQRRT